METVRTPDERFEGLPDFDYAPHYREHAGLRLAHLDEGDPAHPPVVFVHGEPTWSFLWRHVFPVVRDAGHRCVVPDHAGFGRSDKPTDFDWYTYERHVDNLVALLDELDLHDATMVVHDWGGPTGLAAAVARRERVSRLVIMDTGLFTGHQKMSEPWRAFRDFVERTEDLPVGFLVKGACLTDPGDDVIAAYEAPYPDAASKAGARAFPLLIPLTPDAPGAEAGRKTLASLKDDPFPTLMLWADQDPILTLDTGRRFAEAIGAPAPIVIDKASHFLQEDAGAVIGGHIAEWLTAGA